jgi:sugar phosphate isomerase/epimerase
MLSSINLCTSILPAFSFSDVVEIALESGYQGIELRVKDDFHQSLAELEQHGPALRRSLEQRGLQIPILNSYAGVDQPADRLIECARRMGVPRLRLVLPRSAKAAVARLSREQEIIPSYAAEGAPQEIFRSVQQALRQLERQARRTGVKILLELHWGTIMSSFTAAWLLLKDFDPGCIGVTLDPANMVVEGREDWEFGIQLMRDYIDNVHVKNAVWSSHGGNWCWHWSPVFDGMVDWSEMLALLDGIGYCGDYAMEDFLTPRGDKAQAQRHLTAARLELEAIGEPFAPQPLVYT